MEALIIKQDEENTTPEVILDKENNRFELTGNSLPEDVILFYSPIIKWIEEYTKVPNPVTRVKIKPNYFNSASFKIMLDILAIFEKLKDNGHAVEVQWHYLEMDEDMLTTGKEFESLVKVPFEFIPFME